MGQYCAMTGTFGVNYDCKFTSKIGFICIFEASRRIESVIAKLSSPFSPRGTYAPVQVQSKRIK